MKSEQKKDRRGQMRWGKGVCTLLLDCSILSAGTDGRGAGEAKRDARSSRHSGSSLRALMVLLAIPGWPHFQAKGCSCLQAAVPCDKVSRHLEPIVWEVGPRTMVQSAALRRESQAGAGRGASGSRLKRKSGGCCLRSRRQSSVALARSVPENARSGASSLTSRRGSFAAGSFMIHSAHARMGLSAMRPAGRSGVPELSVLLRTKRERRPGPGGSGSLLLVHR